MPAVFQFLHGTIKGFSAQNFLDCARDSFNSYMVRLKACRKFCRGQSVCPAVARFNSYMVRLKCLAVLFAIATHLKSYLVSIPTWYD